MSNIRVTSQQVAQKAGVSQSAVAEYSHLEHLHPQTIEKAAANWVTGQIRSHALWYLVE